MFLVEEEAGTAKKTIDLPLPSAFPSSAFSLQPSAFSLQPSAFSLFSTTSSLVQAANRINQPKLFDSMGQVWLIIRFC